MFSLLDIALRHQPADSDEIDPEDLFEPLHQYVVSCGISTRRRQVRGAGGNHTILYVKDETAPEVVACIESFWRQFRDGANTCVAVGSNNNGAETTASTTRKRKKVIHGAHDLFPAVIRSISSELTSVPENRERIRMWLRENFVCTMPIAARWSVLWPISDSDDMPTFIDVTQDPIVTELAEWLTKRLQDWIANPSAVLDPSPVYPASRNPDPRPVPTLPDYFCDIDIMKIYIFKTDPFFYLHFKDIREVGVALSEAKYLPAIHPERYRQWQRITEKKRFLTFSEIARPFFEPTNKSRRRPMPWLG